MKLADRCKQGFDSGDRSRGRSYYHDELAQIEEVTNDRVYASVAGSYADDYDVVIDWHGAQDAEEVAVCCSCPRFAEGWNCKHIWATLLEMDDYDLGSEVRGRGNLYVEGNIDLTTDGFAIATAKSSGTTRKRKVVKKTVKKTAKKKSRASRSKKPQKPPWQKTFDLLNQKTSLGADTWDNGLVDALVAKQREVWYVLSIGQSIANESLIVDFFQRETKQNGEFGKIKKLKLKEDEISSFGLSVDQDLLSQLVQFAHYTEYNSSYSYRNYGYNESATAANIPSSLVHHFLPRLAETGRLVWILDSEQPFEDAKPLTWDGAAPWQFELTITPDEKKKRWVVDAHFSRDGQTRLLHEAIMATPSGLLLMDDTLFGLDIDESAYRWLHAINISSPIEVPYKDRELFLKQLWATSTLPKINLPENLRWEQIQEPPQPKLKIYSPEKSSRSRHKGRLSADVSFLYGSHEVRAEDQQFGIPEGTDLVHVRDRSAETSRLAELGSLGARPVDRYYGSKGDVQFAQKQLMPLVDQLTEKGWHIEAEGKLYRTAGDFKIDVQSDIDWFELDASFDFDGVEAKLPELLTAVRKGEKFVELDDGSRGMLPEKWLARYQHLADLGTVEDGKVRFQPSQALLLDSMLDEQENLHVDRQFNQFRKRLRQFDGVKAKDEPKTFCGTLRDYQRDGLGWFHFLRELRLGGCLADDMGLGKTIQVLAMLENRRTRRLKKDESRRPSLVVAPKSLIFNWIDEAVRFTPKLRVADYTGLDRKQLVGNLDDYHLVVTTYGTMRRDIAELKDQRFDYAILDESQAIKNNTSLSAKASRLLDASHRLSLTGTPIENHLGELWSLFEFLNPGMLGRSGAFARLCKSAKSGEEGSLTDLSRAVAPFILRRTKDQVLKELPAKTEQMIYCDLLPKQRKQYDELRDYYRKKLTKKIGERGLKQSKIHVLEALLRLRQTACHPGLVDKKKVAQPSAKLDVLLEQIREIVAEGHKALVFSQFTSLLAIVRSSLDAEGIRYEYLDGRTRNRKEKVEQFQTDATCPLFLISLKAGGSGLNLTAADYVFILDPWWNPAVEAQAIDRTHRIGQTRPVFAYRIIARDTVEEKVLKLQESKRKLADAIISADDSLLRNLTADDLQMILS